MKKSLFFAWCAVALLWSAQCFADITVAVIAPKAGDNVKAGNELFEGARLAVNEINDNGGINGQKLDLLTIDDRCDDRLAVSTSEMLSLLNSLEQGKIFERPTKVVWECANCGCRVESPSAPEVCPVCEHPQAYFFELQESF